MKKIGLLSDTHGYLDPKVFEYFAEVDEIWHAGDVGGLEIIDTLEGFKPLRAVYGNIDGHEVRAALPKDEVFMCEGMKIYMTHIGGKPYRYNRDAHAIMLKERPNVFICGHSHILLVQFDKKINALWLNPGACGYKGFHKVKTLLRFEVHGNEMKNMEVIEIGPRIDQAAMDLFDLR